MKKILGLLLLVTLTAHAGERVQKVSVSGLVEARNYADIKACKTSAREISRGLITLEGGGASELSDTHETFVLTYVGGSGLPRRHVDIYCYGKGEMRLYILMEVDKPTPPIVR